MQVFKNIKIFLERDIVGLKPATNNLVYLASEADCDDEIKLPVTTLKSCPHTKVLTGLADTHIYLVNFSILNRLLDSRADRFVLFSPVRTYLIHLISNWTSSK